MTLKFTLRGVFIVLLTLTPALASANSKKCAPGSYWDERDQMFIWGNGP